MMARKTGVLAAGLKTAKEAPRQGVGGVVQSVVLQMNEGASCEEAIPNGRGEASNHGTMAPKTGIPAAGLKVLIALMELWIWCNQRAITPTSSCNCAEECCLTYSQCISDKSEKHPLNILGIFLGYNCKLLIYDIWQYGIYNNIFLDLSKSVGLVIIGGKPCGSSFLLWDTFVLTNAHVIKSAYNFKTGQLTNDIAVTFSYETQESECYYIDVQDVVCCGFGNKRDWALLKVSGSMPLPNGLLPHIKSVSDTECSNIFIIGHPNCEVKQVDFCPVVCSENRNQVVEENWRKNPGSNGDYYNRAVKEIPDLDDRLTYNSNSYRGSSGSPVFNEEGNLVAMHSGGYFYHDAKGHPQSLLDYGYPLSNIIKDIELQMV